jgi:hypothetical protein
MPDFEKQARKIEGLSESENVKIQTALLQKIEYNTDIIRLVLVWTAVIIPLLLLGLGITSLVFAHEAVTPANPFN